MSNVPNVFVKLHTFDETKVVIEDPETIKYAKTGTSSNLSKIFYLNAKGEKCALFFEGAPNFTFGVMKEYQFGKDKTDEDKADPANLKGYKLTYMLTDQERVGAPTADEKATIAVFEAITRKAIDHAHQDRVLALLEELIPAQSTLIEKARDRKIAHGGIKPMICDGTSKDERTGKTVADPSKPKRIYAKLDSYKDRKAHKIVCRTVFWVGDKEVDPVTMLETRGELRPIFKVKSIWWGDHKTKPYAGGIQFILAEAIFTPHTDRTTRFFAPSDVKEAPVGAFDEPEDRVDERAALYNINSAATPPAGDEEESEAEDEPELVAQPPQRGPKRRRPVQKKRTQKVLK